MMVCKVKSCPRPNYGGGLCQTHRWQMNNWGFTRESVEPRYRSKTGFCEVEDCGEKHVSGGLCSKHYARKTKYNGAKRTIHDRNEIIIDGAIARIQLYNGSNEVIAEAMIDTPDVALVSGMKWHASGPFKHVRTQGTGLHNVILGVMLVDHINRNPLDNRRCNLRRATPAENARNNGGRRGKEFKGVFFDNMTKKKYKAAISGHTIGRYSTPEEAAWMYDQFALAAFGDFAFLNFEYTI